MRNVRAARRVVRRILLAVFLAASFAWGTFVQSGAQVQQMIMIPDPTPRPPDLQREYGDDPVARARQLQIALLKRTQRRQKIVAATDKLVLLTEELRDASAKSEKGSSTRPGAVKAEEIEKLAKKVKEDSKLQ